MLFGRGENASLPLKLACVSGLGMTLLFMVLSVFPIIDVPNSGVFTAKVLGAILTFNIAGALLYLRGRARAQARNRIRTQ